MITTARRSDLAGIRARASTHPMGAPKSKDNPAESNDTSIDRRNAVQAPEAASSFESSDHGALIRSATSGNATNAAPIVARIATTTGVRAGEGRVAIAAYVAGGGRNPYSFSVACPDGPVT